MAKELRSSCLPSDAISNKGKPRARSLFAIVVMAMIVRMESKFIVNEPRVSSYSDHTSLPLLPSFTVGVKEEYLLDGPTNSQEPDSKLRSRKLPKLDPYARNDHVSRVKRRLYSKEDAYVRRNRNIIENLSERSQSGLVDPAKFDLVKYENHPMQAWADRHRRLVEQHNGDLEKAHKAASEQTLEPDQRRLESGSAFKPLRIYFYTEALDAEDDGTNTDKIQFIKEQILPQAANFWTNTLSVVPVSGDLTIDTTDLADYAYCGNVEFSKVPESHITTGVPDADLILYVSGTNSTTFCGPNTLAVAVACNFDGYDRPTAGAVNICLGQIQLNSDGSWDDSVLQENIAVVTHEMAHVLALSSNHFRFYRKEDGEPRTSRSFGMTNVKCVDGVVRSEYLPSSNTLDFFTSEAGARYAAITTERVRAVARNQFDCQKVPGGRLENQPDGGSCFGDHWDERVYYDETMSPVIAEDMNFLSPVTVALCEDSGWYLGNYTMSRIMPWGHGAGCDFFNNTCLSKDDNGKSYVPDYGKGFFCTGGSQRGCGPAHTHKMACTVIDYDLYLPSVPPPSEYQYFSSNPSEGGLEQADYCPVYGSTYKGLQPNELDCRNPDNEDFVNLYGEYWGENSMCFDTVTDTYGGGRCYKGQCVLSERKLNVYVRGQWKTCNSDFEEIEIVSNTGVFEGKVICPRLAVVCPEMFCPANCAGRGVCDFQNEVNGTVVPKCKCFNSSDTSEGCSSSLILEGKYNSKYISNSGDLQGVGQSTNDFFGPLVSVFVDKPETWTQASWIWAGAILILLLSMTICICSSFCPAPRKKKAPVRRRRKY